MPKKKTTKKVTKKTEEKEVIPSPLGAKPPELSERAPEPTEPVKPKVVEKTVEKPQIKQPPYNKAFQAVCGIPGISAKQKSEVASVMKENWGKNKTVFIESVVNIGGLKNKKKVIEKVLNGAL